MWYWTIQYLIHTMEEFIQRWTFYKLTLKIPCRFWRGKTSERGGGGSLEFKIEKKTIKSDRWVAVNWNIPCCHHLGPILISDKTSYFMISQSLEAAIFVFLKFYDRSEKWEALLLMCLSNFKAIRLFKLPISRVRDFMRCYDKTHYRILNRGPGDDREMR